MMFGINATGIGRNVSAGFLYHYAGRGFLVVLGLCLALLGGPPVLAADFRLVPGLDLKEEYNDNLFLDEDKPEDDFITTMSPSLEFDRDTERTKLKLTGRIGVIEYADHDDLSAVDQRYSGRLSVQQSPRLGLSMQGDYLRDHRPDRDFLVSGLLFDAVRRERWTLGGAGSYAMTERNRLDGRYSYASETFPGGNFTDSDTHYVSASHVYDWSPRLAQSLTLDYSHTTYDAANLDNVRLQLGLMATLAERWNFDASVGGRYTRSKFETYERVFEPPYIVSVKQNERSDETGGVAHLKLRYRTDRTRVSVGGNYDVELASGRSGAVTQTALTLDLIQRLHREISGYVHGGYYFNNADAKELADEEIDSRNLRLSAGFRWDLSPDWGTSLDYQFVRYDDRTDDTRANRHLVALRLLYRTPLWD